MHLSVGRPVCVSRVQSAEKWPPAREKQEQLQKVELTSRSEQQREPSLSWPSLHFTSLHFTSLLLDLRSLLLLLLLLALHRNRNTNGRTDGRTDEQRASKDPREALPLIGHAISAPTGRPAENPIQQPTSQPAGQPK